MEKCWEAFQGLNLNIRNVSDMKVREIWMRENEWTKESKFKLYNHRVRGRTRNAKTRNGQNMERQNMEKTKQGSKPGRNICHHWRNKISLLDSVDFESLTLILTGLGLNPGWEWELNYFFLPKINEFSKLNFQKFSPKEHKMKKSGPLAFQNSQKKIPKFSNIKYF